MPQLVRILGLHHGQNRIRIRHIIALISFALMHIKQPMSEGLKLGVGGFDDTENGVEVLGVRKVVRGSQMA